MGVKLLGGPLEQHFDQEGGDVRFRVRVFVHQVEVFAEESRPLVPGALSVPEGQLIVLAGRADGREQPEDASPPLAYQVEGLGVGGDGRKPPLFVLEGKDQGLGRLEVPESLEVGLRTPSEPAAARQG